MGNSTKEFRPWKNYQQTKLVKSTKSRFLKIQPVLNPLYKFMLYIQLAAQYGKSFFYSPNSPDAVRVPSGNIHSNNIAELLKFELVWIKRP